MNTKKEINSINFDAPGLVTVCTDKYVLLNKIPEFTIVSHIAGGGPFIHACIFNDVFAVVSGSEAVPYTPNFLLIFQKNTGVFLKSIEFPSPILNIKCNGSMLFISLEDTIQAYDIKEFRTFATIDRKSSLGLFACTNEVIAYPDDRSQGVVKVAMLPGFNVTQTIHCHSGMIQNLTISSDSQSIVTCSNKGTLIRVFSIADGSKTHQFRRGFTQNEVLSLASSTEYVCACSDKTLHVFSKDGRHASASLPCLPIDSIISNNRVMVALSNGIMAIYAINPPDFSIQLINQTKMLPPTPLIQRRNRSYTV